MPELRFQFARALLVVLTAAACVAAFVNFQQQARFRLPEDGVLWVEREEGVRALHVSPGGPAERAGLKPGDLLRRINGAPIERSQDVTRILVGLGAWRRATYAVERNDIPFQVQVILGETRPDAAVYLQYLVGSAWLALGAFVLFRRAGAPKALHFYWLCLATFVLLTFHYTGKLNNFDKAIYLGNVTAGLLAPVLLLHFCLNFPEPRRWLRGWRAAWLYLPAAAVLLIWVGLSSGRIRTAVPLNEMSWLLDRVWIAMATGAWLAGGVALVGARRRTSDPMLRQQLKWLRNGMLAGFAPFTLLYAVPYALGALPGPWAKLTVAGLLLVPLTWAWAILRYRLMDVDVIFRQGYVYTLATLCVLGLFFSLLFSLGRFQDIEPLPVAILLLLAAFVFQPIRNWIEQLLDRHVFYRERYDYRRTLADFARELGAEPDRDTLLERVAERLRSTLDIERVAFFLQTEEGRFYLERIFGPAPGAAEPGVGRDLDLSFLKAEPGKPLLFFERTGRALEVLDREHPPTVRRTLAELDLTYYVPCSVRGRTIAYLGLSRTDTGDFLSSEDLDLVVMVAGYLAIALENARLYSSLERKALEFERLKEYSENIVASIRVGVVAVDLKGRVEGWNPEMERLTGLAREQALGKRLGELLPEQLTEQLERAWAQERVQQIYQVPLRMPGPKVVEMPGRGGNGKPAGRREAAHTESLVNIAVTPLVGREGQQIGRVILFDDVTERSELERRLAQAEKLSAIGLLAAGVAHEVNTPLAVISAYAQMLARQVASDPDKARLLEKITRQTFRASEIVNALLNFSRAAPGTFEEVDLNRLIRDTLLLLEHQFQQADIRVELELEEGLGRVQGDPGKLQQVFLNLFLNARDAMDSGGVLQVRSANDGSQIVVQVRDNGPGIAPENLHKIFDPFFTTKPPRRGTGLGLSISYGIVREHGGEIEVESRPGEGTCFRLVFPPVRKALHA